MKMMNWVVCVSLLCAMTTANAKEGHFILGANFGYSEFDSGFSHPTGTARIDENNKGFTLLFGYQFNDFVSLEGHFGEIGKVNLDLENVQIQFDLTV